MAENDVVCFPIPSKPKDYLIDAVDASPPPLPLLRQGGEEFHVLAVDDSLIERRLIARLLMETCCKVTTVDSAKKALVFLGIHEEQETSEISLVRENVKLELGSINYLQPVKVDLIMTDFCMPEMTGLELLKKIKASSACSQIPVVIMSSDNIDGRIQECLEAGAEDYLIKPVKLQEVERFIDFVKSGRQVDNAPNTEELGDVDAASSSPTYASPPLSASPSTPSFSVSPSVSPPPSGQWSPESSGSPTGILPNHNDSA